MFFIFAAALLPIVGYSTTIEMPPGKYTEVRIYANGSELEHTQLASNRWIVPGHHCEGDFTAILCSNGSCEPLTVSWSSPKDENKLLVFAVSYIIGVAFGLVLILLWTYFKGPKCQ